MTAKTILVADDDAHIRDIIQFALERVGFQVELADNGQAALECCDSGRIDLVVLDIAMPELDGLAVCRQLRKASELPILFLSARDEEIDRVLGLELGGDDYLTKPFSPHELVARVQAILKRSAPPPAPPAARRLQRKSLSLDLDSYSAAWRDQPVPLTATEFALLATLLRHPEKVYARGELIDLAYAGTIVSDRTIDSHMRRIRQKFAEAGAGAIIETFHGIGYKLGPCS